MTSQKYTIYWKILLLLWFIICCKHINSSSLILSHIHSYTVWDNSQSHQKKNYTFKCPLVRRLWFQSWFEWKTISNLLEDLYNFEAIGNWRVVLQDNGKYEKVFVPGNDILRTIRMLLRFDVFSQWFMRLREIKEENEDYRDYSIKLLKFNVVNSKLLPIFIS